MAKTVRFLGENCTFSFGKYGNGQTVIQLYCEDGCPMATATVAIDAHLEEGEIIVKDYSENTGMLQALVDAGVVEPTGRAVACGFITAPIAKLLVEVE